MRIRLIRAFLGLVGLLGFGVLAGCTLSPEFTPIAESLHRDSVTSASHGSGPQIDLCCTWGGRNPQVRTYKISGGSATTQQIVREAMTTSTTFGDGWQPIVDRRSSGRFQLQEVTGKVKADITINIKKGGGRVQGQALRNFDQQFFIKSCKVQISGSAFGLENDAEAVTTITRQEVGHCLGIDHANFVDVMNGNLNNTVPEIGLCDERAFDAANHWIVVDNVSSPHQPHEDHVGC